MKKWWHKKVEKEILSDEAFDNLDEVFNEPTEVIWQPMKLKRSDPQIRAAYQRGYNAAKRRYQKKDVGGKMSKPETVNVPYIPPFDQDIM